jgi:hypothetical protein
MTKVCKEALGVNIFDTFTFQIPYTPRTYLQPVQEFFFSCVFFHESCIFFPLLVFHLNSDAGVGLTREEMVSLLGTIARSGSKAFVAEAKAGGGNSEADAKAANSIIGQFGVRNFRRALIVE